MKKDIRELSQEELEQFFLENKQQKFRVKQLNEWIWKKGATSFKQMSSLSKDLRSLLESNFIFNSAEIDQQFRSYDGTIKYSFKLHDNKLIEGVLIPAGTSTVYDQSLGTNIRRPFLHVRYRASQTEDRRYKNWITGSAGGAYTTNLDAMQVNWLSERCLVTQAANNFVLFQN